MSAFLVSRSHIDVLVAARLFARPYGMRSQGAQLGDHDLGRMLWRENMLSLASRYSDQPVDETALAAYVHRVPPIAWLAPSAIVSILKAIHCYRYQACEHDGWEASEAAAYTKELEAMLVHRLPGYDKAPWGIENIHDDSRRALPEVMADAPILVDASKASTLPAPPSVPEAAPANDAPKTPSKPLTAAQLAKRLFDDDMSRAPEVPVERNGERAYDGWRLAALQAGDGQTLADLDAIDWREFAEAWEDLADDALRGSK